MYSMHIIVCVIVLISNIDLFQILSISTRLYELNFIYIFDTALKPNAQCNSNIFWIDQILLRWPHHSSSNGVRRWGAFKQTMQQMSDLCLYAS